MNERRIYMKFNVDTFLDSDLGTRLENIAMELNKATYQNDKEHIQLCEEQIAIYRDMFQFVFKKEIAIKKTHDFFGIVIKKGKSEEWIIKLDREGLFKEKHYDNRNKRCKCYLCEYEVICPYQNKLQRLPQENGGQGLCWKLEGDNK